LKSSEPDNRTTFVSAPAESSFTEEFSPNLTVLPSWNSKTAGPLAVPIVSPTNSGKEVTPGELTKCPSKTKGTALVTVATRGAAKAVKARKIKPTKKANPACCRGVKLNHI